MEREWQKLQRDGKEPRDREREEGEIQSRLLTIKFSPALLEDTVGLNHVATTFNLGLKYENTGLAFLTKCATSSKSLIVVSLAVK